MLFNFLSPGPSIISFTLSFLFKMSANTHAEFSCRQRSKSRGVEYAKDEEMDACQHKILIPSICGTSLDLVQFVESKPPKTQRPEAQRRQGCRDNNKAPGTSLSPSSVNFFCFFSMSPDLVWNLLNCCQ